MSTKFADSGLDLCIDSGLGLDSGLLTSQTSISSFSLDDSKSNISAVSCSVQDGNRVAASDNNKAFQVDDDGDTLLHLAVSMGLVDISYAIIRVASHPECLDIYNNLYQTPLHLAALTEQNDIARRLILSGATVDLGNKRGNSALHIACEKGDSSMVKAILKPATQCEIDEASVHNYSLPGLSKTPRPSDLINLANYEGSTCVHLAGKSGNKRLLEYLVKCGANIDVQDGKSGKTLLHWAIAVQKVDLVHCLINKCNARVNTRSYTGETPLSLAWSMYKILPKNRQIWICILMLIEKGGEPKAMPVASDNESDSGSESSQVDSDDEETNA
jgi:ankyrin repeat protein